ncbi:GxxExxY protein [Lacimicrobium alkaliphilum]|uniref:GxxExxY protein n=1 Tax=Lacimicrobium alkaliphilum TaxID=1526571 RepID=A0ABQ1QWK6_9ALTE|nr:GxxExxY protein [Lacimicrobium alkaliphilum]GGD49969.1 hypothetical protein GCM10011357_02350 [Lacimicrobium alkaliphilum]
MDNDYLTGQVIHAAINVHRELGPGLMESAYEVCLCHELSLLGLECQRQIELPIIYKGRSLNAEYRLDLLVESSVIVELKAVESILPIHKAQLLTYLKLRKLRYGLLLNFNVTQLRHGICRMLNG